MSFTLSPHILELLSSKICHDLISPIGAINNGIEFMEEMGADGMQDAAQLISYSANKAASKLKAYRMAYGAGGADSIHKPADVHAVIESVIGEDGKITQLWDANADVVDFTPEGMYPKGFCKTLTSILLVAISCLPRGGNIDVQKTPDGETLVYARGQGSSLREGHKNALEQTTAEEDLDTATIHPYVCGMLAQRYGLKTYIKAENPDEVVFAIVA